MIKQFSVLLPVLVVTAGITGCSGTKSQTSSTVNATKSNVAVKAPFVEESVETVPVVYEKRSPSKRVVSRPVQKKRRYISRSNSFTDKLNNAALERLRHRVRYDGKYVKIAYPWGDVPANIGVCTDVVIRSYRKLGIDLQSQVHQDMSAAFNTYPNPRKWGLSKPDTNIDHRRVYNLRNFFQRRGAALPITRNPRNYKPGDLVTWMIGPDLPHIGIVVNRPSKADPNRLMIVHNIAHGPQMEDILFRFPITGHYRYTPAHMNNIPSNRYLVSAPRKDRSLSVAQLEQAALLLGANNRPVQTTAFTKTKPVISVVDLNNAGNAVKAKNSSMKLANLTNEEVKALLSK